LRAGLTVGELPRAELSRQLGSTGLRVRVGPIVAQIRSPLPIIEQGLATHYPAHEVVTPRDFADFHLSVTHSGPLRRLLAARAVFHFGGTSPFNPLPADQAFALLEWGINWSIATHCHQYLIVHAGVVAHGDRALILPAPPGSGKSTLCAALVARGWRLLSDELTIIDPDTRSVVPLPRPISLKNQSIDAIRTFWPDATMSAVVRETLKGAVTYVRPPIESVHAASRHAKPRWIVVPRYAKDQPTQLAALPKARAFMQLVENTFNYDVHGRRGFELLAGVTDASECLEFEYGGALDEAVRLFDDLAMQP
jgi:HprK-related kinase A